MNTLNCCKIDGSEKEIFPNNVHCNEVDKRAIIKRKIQEQMNREDPDDCFMILDLGDVVEKVVKWNRNLSGATPFFAVKCNPDVNVIRILSEMNCGFDCASKSELQLLREVIKVAPERIIFANTWKQPSHIKYAKEQGVKMMTFDSEEELHKVAKIYPEAELVLRISIYDETAEFPNGIKFGCRIENARRLLAEAQNLNLNIVGVSFHIGSGSRNPPIFKKAIGQARQVFDWAVEFGYKMILLDIGGGFPGKKNLILGVDGPFEEFAKAVNRGLETHFPECKFPHLKVLAEPGRYFTESAGTLVVYIIGKRRKTGINADKVVDNKLGLEGYDYFVNNGIFSTFARNLIDYGDVPPIPVDERVLTKETFDTTIYGNTCVEVDYCNKTCKLPELSVGDWLFYEDIGAYCSMNLGTFNGFKPAQVLYVLPDKNMSFMENLEGKDGHGKTMASSN